MDKLLSGFKVDKNSKIPLYKQIADAILDLINSGELARGQRMPTERELSQTLGVSRNTVSMAYEELESRGYILSEQGKGTFVFHRENMEDVFYSYVRELFDHAAAMDYSLEHLREQFNEVYEAESRRILVHTISFVECNHEQLSYLSLELTHRFNVKVHPLMISDLLSGREEALLALAESKLIVTTQYHANQLRRVLEDAGLDIPVVALALEMEMKTLLTVARLKAQEKVGILCLSENFAQNVVYNISRINPDLKQIRIHIGTDEAAAADFIRSQDMILYSPGRARDAEPWQGQVPMAELILLPDTGSMAYLESALNDLGN